MSDQLVVTEDVEADVLPHGVTDQGDAIKVQVFAKGTVITEAEKAEAEERYDTSVSTREVGDDEDAYTGTVIDIENQVENVTPYADAPHSEDDVRDDEVAPDEDGLHTGHGVYGDNPPEEELDLVEEGDEEDPVDVSTVGILIVPSKTREPAGPRKAAAKTEEAPAKKAPAKRTAAKK